MLLFALVVVHLVDLQLVRPERYVEQGRMQRIAEKKLLAGRGALRDRNGDELALSIPQRTIFADPSMIEDPAATARELAPVLGLDPIEVEAKLRRRGEPGRPIKFVELAPTVPDDVADQVEGLDLFGISSFDEFKRFNPSGDLARSVIGRVDTEGVGTSGLEKAFDDELRGYGGTITFERGATGETIAGGKQEITPARPGSDLVLTLDQTLQYEAEEVLVEAVVQAKSKGGMAIITRPNTGEVLAMANVTRKDTGEVSVTSKNLSVTDMFDPGSVNKVITVAGALEEGEVAPADEIFVPYALQVSNHRFKDDHQHADEKMSITDIVADSSNVGTIKLAQMLGPDRVDGYLRSFGFGESTALGLPNEAEGLMLPVEDWSGTSIGSIPIGQGISVTAMQMLAAYNVIANDGRYIAPRLVNAVIDTDGRRRDLPRSDREQVVSPETAQAVRGMLAEVVTRGTGDKAAVPGYTVAGKTGTARKPRPEGGGYGKPGEYRYVSSFAGFVPAERPELSIIIVIDEPGADVSYYASDVAAPAFSKLARVALRDLRIPPTGTAGPSDDESVEPDGHSVQDGTVQDDDEQDEQNDPTEGTSPDVEGGATEGDGGADGRGTEGVTRDPADDASEGQRSTPTTGD